MLQAHIHQAGTPPETLFASSAWFNHWLAAFGGPESGYWPNVTDVSIPHIAYAIQIRHIGPISLRIAAAAANSHTPRFDVVGQSIPTQGQLRQMMKDLDVSALVFPYLSDSSRLMQSLKYKEKLFRWQREACEEAPFICCTGNWDDYLNSRGQTRRSSWQKYERRMQRSGGVFEVLSSPEDILPRIPEILQVEMSGWKGRAGSSITQDSTTRRFYEGLCNDLSRMGKIRLFLIRRNGQIIAFQLATLHEGILSGLKASYLDCFAKESPGQVLQYWITRWAFAEESVRTYDLLGPSSEYKLRFATGVEKLETLYVFAPRLGGILAWLRWSIAPRIKHYLRNSKPNSSTS